MASKSGQSKKAQRAKAKSRPIGTTALSEPLIAEASAAASFSAFSPSGLLFAHVALAIDKHRLRIFDTESGKAVAETVFQNARVSAVHWTQLSNATTSTHDTTDVDGTDAEDGTSRKRKKRKSISGKDVVTTEQVLVVGFSNGTLAIFSPRQGEIIRTLSNPTSTASILSIASQPSSESSGSFAPALWTSSANGHVYTWDTNSGKLLSTLRTSKNTTSQYSAIAVRASTSNTAGVSQLLAAHHRIQLFGATQNPNSVASSREYASFTGHASPVFALEWAAASSSSSSSFLSAAEGDRFVSIWQVPVIEDDEDYDSDEDEAAPEGALIASIPLDTDVRSVGYAPSSASTSSVTYAYALSASGALRIFAPPSEPSVSTKGKHIDPITSVPGSNVSTAPSAPPIVSVCFDSQRPGSVRVARLVTGTKPVFDRVEFLGTDGSFISDIKLKAPPADQVDDSNADKVLSTKRYKEGNDLTIRSGAELVAATGADSAQDGTLDTSLAELSLGQRLASSKPNGGNTIDHAQPGDSQSQAHFILKADAPTLTRTLTQALHSNDTPLLESVLANSSRALIAGTVQRLQPQYALPLIMACVERINRGARAGRGKGRGGGASAQRAELMVRWIRAVLVAHTAHLMTVPDLVSRLSALHTTVVQRTSLQDRLLSLNGRLDLVLAQIEYRATLPAPAPVVPAAPAQLSNTAKKRKARKERKRAEGAKYVEGESSDDDEDVEEQNAMQVDGEEDDEEEAMESEEDGDVSEAEDEGSVEDIELGAEDSDADSGSGDESLNGDEDDEDESGSKPRTNGFLDLEAEESSGESDSVDDQEE